MMPKRRAWDKIRKTMYGDEDIVSIDLSKEGLGRNKPTVKHYLYRAYMLGV